VKNLVPHIFYYLILHFLLSACTENITERNIPDSNKIVISEPFLNVYSPWVDSVYQTLSWDERIGELIWIGDVEDLISLPHLGGYVITEKSLKLPLYNRQTNTHLSPLFIASNDTMVFNSIGISPEWKGLNTIDSSHSSKLMDAYILLLEALEMHGLAIDTTVFSTSITQGQSQLLRNKLNLKNFITLDTTHPRLKFTEYNSTNSTYPDSIEFLQYASHLGDFVTEILNGQATFIIDRFIHADSVKNYLITLTGMIKAMPNSEELLEPKVRKMLALKEYCFAKQSHHEKILTTDKLTLARTNMIGICNQLLYAGNCLLRNDGTLPIKDFPKKKWRYLVIGNQSLPEFTKGIRHYTDITEDRKTSFAINFNEYGSTGPLIIILHKQTITQPTAVDWVKKIREIQKHLPIIVVAIQCSGIENLKELPVLVEVPVDKREAHYYLAQQLMGGLPINGNSNRSEFSYVSSDKTRLAFTIPEEVGIHPDSLKKIDKIAHEAILSKATPGCQVFIAKEGKVLVNKSYGYHAYDYKTAVLNDHVYDIASVTKVAATTMMAMHQFEKGRFQLSDSLRKFLPDTLTKFLKHPSRLGNITFQELLTHKSGLPSGLPIYKFIAYVNKLIGRFDRYYCDESNSYFCVEVAHDFYLDSAYLDSLWVDMNRIWPGEKVFKYSDANMNALYQVFRPMIKSKKSYDRYLDSILYKPLHLKTMGFLPLKYLDTVRHRIAPTEYDTYWRFQVIKGHVHDPNAALYGGVAGNAGLFSNAFDLGVLFQMLLQKGNYGGINYFKPETVELFTRHQPDSHRGLGFDKPTAKSGNVVAPDAPYSSYGHTGFTGICAWADPENELVFVFTSNRVHPSPNNKKLIEHGIRKRIHQVIYQQLIYNGTYLNKAANNIPPTHLNALENFIETQ
jgi:CubicO group peptidase (beta-lactamase class C family)